MVIADLVGRIEEVLCKADPALWSEFKARRHVVVQFLDRQELEGEQADPDAAERAKRNVRTAIEASKMIPQERRGTGRRL